MVTSEQSYPVYLRRIGGNPSLAKLYWVVGNVFMQGLGPALSGSTSTISNSPFSLHDAAASVGSNLPDVETARRYFRRARVLDPSLDIPEPTDDKDVLRLVMPSMDLDPGQSATTVLKDETMIGSARLERRRRRERRLSDDEGQWSYLYLPGLVGAGLAIGVVGIMSATWWRSSSR